ncbi:multiple coagulation factor deficiency protein 2 homolog [Lineus longissimus]|uniref:multiple coagulation factor deficiency protein 2 homolog n=1 Tax=Lineus longissimus TaxID=88925 RepID=UPI002B4F833C
MDTDRITTICLMSFAAILLGSCCFGHDHAHKLGDKAVVQDAQHMQEHLDDEGVKANATNMSYDEQIFYYFKLHDYDNSSTIDGLELYKAQMHMVDKDEKLTQALKDDVVEEIDKALKQYDFNNDGLIDYIEYKHAYFES